VSALENYQGQSYKIAKANPALESLDKIVAALNVADEGRRTSSAGCVWIASAGRDVSELGEVSAVVPH
jgi:hypothetical protein